MFQNKKAFLFFGKTIEDEKYNDFIILFYWYCSLVSK